MPEGVAIQKMFSGIAGRYDLANHLLSGGTDYYWRNVLIKKVCAEKPQVVIDLATGSGDVALEMQRKLPAETQIRGLDFCRPMLDQADIKKNARANQENLKFEFGDCMDLPLEDNSVDVITISFGFRNFEDRDRGLNEMHRVLKPNGKLFILEFSQPYNWFRPFYYFYLKAILPLFAKLATGNKEAYHYLAGSISDFPHRDALTKQIQSIGFSNVTCHPLTCCIVAIHEATAKK